jgi:2,5-diketo-D-gluconate reductase A
MADVPTLMLNTGAPIPQIGLGTARVTDQEEIRRIVRDAIGVGYRHIDTAAKYENEVGVGRGIADSGVDRAELFVTTKLRGSEQGADITRDGLARSLDRLGLDYVDLYLIHWPLPRLDKYAESWTVMEQLRDEGLTRAIGVSNFLPEHLDRLAEVSTTVPATNQIELHPQFPQPEARADDERRGIVTVAWSPLANANALLQAPVLAEIGQRHGKSPVQVVLRWHLQIGVVAIPKASHIDRLRANIDVFDFGLDEREIQQIDGLATGRRVADQDPATYEEF